MPAHSLMAMLSGEPIAPAADLLITPISEQPARVHAEYRALRARTFVDEQHIFRRTDHDAADDQPETVVLVAVNRDGRLLGGVRLAPVTDTALGWWRGSRLVLAPDVRGTGVGARLIRAACAWADTHDVLRLDAAVQRRHTALFAGLGWTTGPTTDIGGVAHLQMRWPVDRFTRLAAATKAMLGAQLAPFAGHPLGLGPAAFRGDDGVPVPEDPSTVHDGAETLVAACDAILPRMAAMDPEWAGWCAGLVNVNDLTAMGARPVGLLDAVAAPTASHLTRLIRGLARAALAWDVPVLGGHTQLGVPAALSVTALGRARRPVPGGGARAGDALTVTADLSGSWRPGYAGRQWDSTSQREPAELRALSRVIADSAPRAAKDVSMAGLVGTVGMMAEASGCAAELDVAAVPRPAATELGQWLTCFPGYAMVTADRPGRAVAAGPATSAPCGRFGARSGSALVTLRWPDGVTTTALDTSVTGLAPATRENR